MVASQFVIKIETFNDHSEKVLVDPSILLVLVVCGQALPHEVTDSIAVCFSRSSITTLRDIATAIWRARSPPGLP
jgi:hypothetical protein